MLVCNLPPLFVSHTFCFSQLDWCYKTNINWFDEQEFFIMVYILPFFTFICNSMENLLINYVEQIPFKEIWHNIWDRTISNSIRNLLCEANAQSDHRMVWWNLLECWRSKYLKAQNWLFEICYLAILMWSWPWGSRLENLSFYLILGQGNERSNSAGENFAIKICLCFCFTILTSWLLMENY